MKDGLDPSTRLHALILDPAADGAAAQVVRRLVCRGAATSADISEATGLSRASVSMALAELRDQGLVIESVAETENGDATSARAGSRRARGRPQMLQSIAPGVGLIAGVLLGLRELRIMLSDAAHAQLDAISVPMPIDYDPARGVEVLRETVAALLAARYASLEQLLGIGLAISAPVSPEGRVARGSIVPGWDGIDLATSFAPAFPCPVHADNESNCAARAMMFWGPAKGLDDFVYVTFDYGIGGAVVIDGRVQRGADGFAAEIGHLPVEHPGSLCRCGKHGCLETLATVDVVLDQLCQVKGRAVTLAALAELLDDGDNDAIATVAGAARACGRAFATISSVLSPGHFLLDGILTSLGPPFLDPLRESFAAEVRGSMPDLVDATSEVDDTVRGAVGLVLCQKGRLSPRS